MDPEYEKYNNTCGIKKGHEIQITVREATGKMTQGKGALLWTNTSNEYGKNYGQQYIFFIFNQL